MVHTPSPLVACQPTQCSCLRALTASLPAFDVALLGEALVLSGALRTRRMEMVLAKENSAAAGWLAQRNQLLAVLRDR